jgi:multicomponent Na+:H+ antiporter subunit E
VVADLLLRAALFSLLWWSFAEGRRIEWGFAVVGVTLATVVAHRRAGTREIRLTRLVGFVPYFLRRSVLAGVDVAWRALAPSGSVRPGFITLSLQLDSSQARMFYARVISLLPGTVAVRLEHDQLLVHALDVESPVEATLRELEARVAALFEDPAGI